MQNKATKNCRVCFHSYQIIARLTLWEEQRSAKQHLAKLPIPTGEQLAPGHKSEWKLWKSLSRNPSAANLAGTQVGLFHLRGRGVGGRLSLAWSGVGLRRCDFPVCLGVALDRALSYGQHIEKVKGGLRAGNGLLRELAGSSWGAGASTLRATALALCYSVAEYACPVWERSSHAKKVDASLSDSCRCITGCLRPTNVDSLYVLAGIAPPGVRRSVASRTVITTNQPQAA